MTNQISIRLTEAERMAFADVCDDAIDLANEGEAEPIGYELAGRHKNGAVTYRVDTASLPTIKRVVGDMVERLSDWIAGEDVISRRTGQLERDHEAIKRRQAVRRLGRKFAKAS